MNHIQPYATLEVAGNQPIALYRTKTRILVTHPIATFAAYFWLPKNSSLKIVKTAAEIYFKGHADGWEGCKYWQPIFDEGVCSASSMACDTGGGAAALRARHAG